jgi:hypothetical protein
MRYVKVWFRGASKREAQRGIFLRVTRDTTSVLSGYEVDRDGEEIQPHGFERRLRVIALPAIIDVREYHMDRTYATLVPGPFVKETP